MFSLWEDWDQDFFQKPHIVKGSLDLKQLGSSGLYPLYSLLSKGSYDLIACQLLNLHPSSPLPLINISVHKNIMC